MITRVKVHEVEFTIRDEWFSIKCRRRDYTKEEISEIMAMAEAVAAMHMRLDSGGFAYEQ